VSSTAFWYCGKAVRTGRVEWGPGRVSTGWRAVGGAVLLFIAGLVPLVVAALIIHWQWPDLVKWYRGEQ
jgi:hypothetical protein